MMRILLTLTLLLGSVLVRAQAVPGNSKELKMADSLFAAQQWKHAIPLYEKVVKEQQSNSLAWNRMGFCYHNLAEYDKAARCYLVAIETKPASSLEIIIQVRLSRVYALQADREKAFAWLDKAIQLGYANLNELNTSTDFNNLRSDNRFQSHYERAKVNAYPCLGNKQAHEFDFWIGEWDAYVTGTTNLAGHSKIERASGGCMILENWTSVGQSFEGKSMNFVDPTTNTWKQIWVGSNGINATEFLNGVYRDEAMRFEYEGKDAQGKPQWVKFHFYNQGPDQVRQLHQVSSDAGKTWTVTYDFTYKRRK